MAELAETCSVALDEACFRALDEYEIRARRFAAAVPVRRAAACECGIQLEIQWH